jgi:methylated-DNA-[protein]-cysteine S-methyltransferase
MKQGLRFHVCQTGLGWVGLAFSERGLRAATLPRPSRGDAPAAEAVRAIVAGRANPLSLQIDWEGISPFRRAVMEEALRIPRGEVRSYGWLAARAGRPRAARAAGRVMATNPLPLIVPCHRVVGSGGALHGYGGGLTMKAALLRAEGAL